MLPCPSCKKEIDVNANSCPNCGRPNPISKEMVESETKRMTEELKKRMKWKSEDEIRGLYDSARQHLLNKDFQLAYNCINSAKSSIYDKKSFEECVKELRDICKEIGLSEEFEKWQRKKDFNARIFAFIIVILLVFVVVRVSLGI